MCHLLLLLLLPNTVLVAAFRTTAFEEASQNIFLVINRVDNQCGRFGEPSGISVVENTTWIGENGGSAVPTEAAYIKHSPGLFAIETKVRIPKNRQK